jgi:hypothetical protein
MSQTNELEESLPTRDCRRPRIAVDQRAGISFLLAMMTVLTFLYYILLPSSCENEADRLPPVRDHLESYVIVGFDKPPVCPLPWSDRPKLIDAGTPVTFWLRSVFADHLLVPSPKKRVEFSVVNDFGEDLPGEAAFFGTVISDDNGFAMLPTYVTRAPVALRIKLNIVIDRRRP